MAFVFAPQTPNLVTEISKTLPTVDQKLYKDTISAFSPMSPIISPMAPIMSPMSPSSFIVPTTISYEDINYNPEIRQKIVKEYYKKLRNHWVKHFKKVLSLLTVKKDPSGKEIAELVKDESQPDETGDRDVKVDYLKTYILSKEYVAKVLNKFLIKHEIDWIDLAQYHHEIKKYMKKVLYKKLLKYL
jgi:hypothetical protein